MKFISAMLLLQKEEIVKLILFAQVRKLSEFSSYLPLSCNLWRIATVLYMYVEFLYYFYYAHKKRGQAKGLRYSQKSLLYLLSLTLLGVLFCSVADSGNSSMGHFRSSLDLCMRTRVSAQPRMSCGLITLKFLEWYYLVNRFFGHV